MYLVGKPIVCLHECNNVYVLSIHDQCIPYIMMKGKFNKFDESGSNPQTNATQNEALAIYILFNLLYEHCIELHSLLVAL